MNETQKIALTIHQRHCIERVHNESCMFWIEDHESAQALVNAGVTFSKPTQ
jgi:hypothetical protein